jgi:hypothetical protein
LLAAGATTALAVAQGVLNAVMALNPIFLVVLAIGALIGILYLAWRNSETFRRIVTGAFNAVVGAARTAFGWVRKNWPLLLAILTGPFGLAVLAIVKNWDKIKEGARKALEWITTRWNEFVQFIRDIPGRFARGWDALVAGFRRAVGMIMRAWNALDFGIDITLPSFLGGFSFKVDDLIPDIPIPKGYASGGVLPGYKPGKDTIPAILSPGEGVLRPEVVRLLGKARIDALNAAARRGSISRDKVMSILRGDKPSRSTDKSRDERLRKIRTSRQQSTSAAKAAVPGLYADTRDNVEALRASAATAGATSTVVNRGTVIEEGAIQMIVNNPVPETGSETANARLRSLAAFGLFGGN